MSRKIIRTCIDRVYESTEELAVVTASTWKSGKTLSVCFLDGDSRVQTKVEQVAHQWSLYANINFVFGTDPDAEIRISFTADPGSWSYIGQDALNIPKSEPTMNYGWLKLNTSDQEYERVVLHEFGHALGCIHEHQNPATNIPWNKPAVYRYYAGLGWDKATVDHNLFDTYSANHTQFTKFDTQSIMLYPIPKELTDGMFEVGWNTALSATDKSFIASIYPKTGPVGTVLQVGGEPFQAELHQGGEIHLYRFQISTPGSYRIETTGRTDVVMSLFGPDDRTAKLAEDDDSGLGLNARINATLEPATYYAEVRHYRKGGGGKYRISVSATT